MLGKTGRQIYWRGRKRKKRGKYETELAGEGKATEKGDRKMGRRNKG